MEFNDERHGTTSRKSVPITRTMETKTKGFDNSRSRLAYVKFNCPLCGTKLNMRDNLKNINGIIAADCINRNCSLSNY